MMQSTIPKEWFYKKYRSGDSLEGYLALRYEALNRLHHITALFALSTYTNADRFSTVIDVGCACGDFTDAVCNKFRIEQAIGLDFVRIGLDVARERYSSFEVVEAALPKLPIGDSKADLVLAMEVLYYLSDKDLQEAAEQLERILKPNGILVVSVNLGSRDRELTEAEVHALFSKDFDYLSIVYEYCGIQQRVHKALGKLIRIAKDHKFSFIISVCSLLRRSMVIGRFNYMIGRLMFREYARSKAIFVFRKNVINR